MVTPRPKLPPEWPEYLAVMEAWRKANAAANGSCPYDRKEMDPCEAESSDQ